MLPSRVKYVIIIPDGCADLPIPQLDDRTPLEAATLPNLARLAKIGRVGAAHTTPPGFEAGSDVCSMDLLGYDPAEFHTGRAPLEAAALGLSPGPADWIFRLNLVTAGQPGSGDDGLMLDHSAGAITDKEARALIADLTAFWRTRAPRVFDGFTVTPGVSYRNIMVDSSGRDFRHVTCTPPHAIPREPWRPHLPEGDSREAADLRTLIELSAEFLPGHEINRARTDQGLRPANMAWLWGQGTRPRMPLFKDKYGFSGAMITAVDLLAGIAAYMGWNRVPCPGITSYHDTDYASQGRVTIEALRSHDVVCCHIEAPDEASHQGDWRTKVESLEAIDRHIVGPVAAALEAYGNPAERPGEEGWRLLVMPDHYTLCSTRKHDATPVPFLMAGAWVRSLVERPFTEAAAAESDLIINPGHELMEYFLRGGVVSARGRRAK